MWDPRNYRDTDYGLGDEPFEPPDAAGQDDVDLTRPHVMTVLGPITPDELGVCLPHEHLLRDVSRIAQYNPDARLDRIDLASEELESFAMLGGRSIVEVTPWHQGRDLVGLRSIAQRVPVNVIATAGARQRATEPVDRAKDASAVAAAIHADMGGNVKPGLIAFAAADSSTPAGPAAVRGAALAAIASGYPLLANSGHGTTAHEHLDLLEPTGIDPARVIVGEVHRSRGYADLLSIVRRGAWLSLDWIGRSRGYPDQDDITARLLMRLAEAGYEKRLLISQGLSRRSDFISYGGGPGLTHLLERFTLDLMEAGASAELVRTLLIDNPARALAIVPPAGA